MINKTQEETYKKILKYYYFAQKLVNVIEQTNYEEQTERIAMLEPLIEQLELSADKLGEKYIEFIKHGEASSVADDIGIALEAIAVRINDCKKHIYGTLA